MSFRGALKRRARKREIPRCAIARLRSGAYAPSRKDKRRGARKKASGVNAIVTGRVPLFAVFGGAYVSGMSGSNACAATLFGRTVDFKFRPICEERELI